MPLALGSANNMHQLSFVGGGGGGGLEGQKEEKFKDFQQNIFCVILILTTLKFR